MITVITIAGVTTVQDGGRAGHMHEGVPPGGALVPELLARANAAVGNADDDAGLEVFGAIAIAGRRGTLVASDDGIPRELAEPGRGAPWRVACDGARVRYVAVRGGIDVPSVLGGRGTLLGAGLGGLEGRALQAGDVLRAGTGPAVPHRPVLPFDLGAPVRVVLGPDLDRFPTAAVEALLAGVFVVDARSDRVGTRLLGPTIPRANDPPDAPSSPMVRGAIQLPPSGGPIVLGPDHPTTGGYPVLATVVRSCLGSLAGRPVGAEVRFLTAP
jgi:biotin-dependent carboxylase-like uncharacterized protein